MRSWWKNAESPSIPSVAFSVTCLCGRVTTGLRLASPQSLFCSGCGGDLFVLPDGPWLKLARSTLPQKKPAPSRKLTLRDLLLPVAATALALALLVLLYLLWIGPQLFPSRRDLPLDPGVVKLTRGERLTLGQKLLAEGSFRLALEEMTGDPPDLQALAPEDRRVWQQTRRQAAVLADLLSEPLEDIIRHGAGVREHEWHADFRHRFLGKSVVLDADFRKPAGGSWEVLYPLFHGQERARLVVDNLKILAAVPSHDAQRLIIGVRLASVGLEPPGPTWVVRVDGDSGVFLTEPSAAARICPAFADPEAVIVLERQQRWVE